MSELVLVTGSGRGLGSSIAKSFIDNGYKVAINYFKSKDKAENLSKELGDNAHAFCADVSDANQVKRMINSGVSLIASGANVPFADKEIFFGSIAEYADNHLSVIPDFISNCGMARVFAYLMDKRIEVTDKGIFEDCSQVIYNALNECFKKNKQKVGITATALEIALKKLTK